MCPGDLAAKQELKRTELAALLSDSRLSNGKVSQASASTLTCSSADPGLPRIPMAVPQDSPPSSPEVLDKEGVIWPLRDNFPGVPLPAGREISGLLLTFSSRQSTCLAWTKPRVPLPAACTHTQIPTFHSTQDRLHNKELSIFRT